METAHFDILCSELAIQMVVRSPEYALGSYLEDSTVPEGSVCPTYAVAVLKIHNRRWDGVPFIMKAGKALDERKVPHRINCCA